MSPLSQAQRALSTASSSIYTRSQAQGLVQRPPAVPAAAFVLPSAIRHLAQHRGDLGLSTGRAAHGPSGFGTTLMVAHHPLLVKGLVLGSPMALEGSGTQGLQP